MEWSAKEYSAVIVASIAAAVSLISAFFNYFISRRTTYLNSVTVERSKWIDKLRTNISTFSGLVRTLSFRSATDKKTSEYLQTIEKVNGLISLITLQLNPEGEIDRKLICLLERIPSLAEKQNSDALVRADKLLIAHSQWLLKAEWEKVKAEARGQRVWDGYYRHLCKYRQFCLEHNIEALGADATSEP